MRITSKGQVTIPLRIRERYGLMPETQVEFVERDGVVIVQKATRRRGVDGADRLIDALRGSGTTAMSTDEILRLTRGDDD
jgi:AbrB family looped-hinge helix DNA binding protein